MANGQKKGIPVPLEGGRILHTMAAQLGTLAWFRVKDGDDGVVSQPVLCFAVMENEERDALGHVYRRTHDIVPYVCGGSGGFVDATLLDDLDYAYIGTTGPGESLDRILKFEAEDGNEEDGASPVRPAPVIPNTAPSTPLNVPAPAVDPFEGAPV
jgi:hypothetical protein